MGLKAIFPLTLSGEDKTHGGRRKKSPMRGKGVKYIIYPHWRRETNAFTVIEDALPSHIDTRKHTHLGFRNAAWTSLKQRKLIFLK